MKLSNERGLYYDYVESSPVSSKLRASRKLDFPLGTNVIACFSIPPTACKFVHLERLSFAATPCPTPGLDFY